MKDWRSHFDYSFLPNSSKKEIAISGKMRSENLVDIGYFLFIIKEYNIRFIFQQNFKTCVWLTIMIIEKSLFMVMTAFGKSTLGMGKGQKTIDIYILYRYFLTLSKCIEICKSEISIYIAVIFWCEKILLIWIKFFYHRG